MPKVEFKAFAHTPPQRAVKQQCEVCNQNFNNLTLREHVCKRCYRSVCDDCSPYKVRSYRADLQHRLHRMCKICHKESQILNKYNQNNKLSWGQDSDMCFLWLKQLGYNPKGAPRASIRRSINNLDDYEINALQLWGSLNFSFREFVGIAIDRSKKLPKQVIQQISGCLSEIMNTMVHHKMQSQHIVYIIMFFLAHSSPVNTLIFTKSIIQILSCQEPSVENILFYLERFHCSQIECYKMESYLENNLQEICNTATINYFTTEVSIQIITAIISKKYYQQIQKGIAYVLNLRKDFITKNASKSQAIILDILKNVEGLGINYRKALKEIEDPSSILGGNKSHIDSSIQLSEVGRSHKQYAREKVQELVNQNEELKIKNKNQEDQIARLRAQNNKLRQKQAILLRQKQEHNFTKKDQQWDKIRKKSIAMERITQQNIRNQSPARKSRNILVSMQNYQPEDSQFEKIDEGSDVQESIYHRTQIEKNQEKFYSSNWNIKNENSFDEQLNDQANPLQQWLQDENYLPQSEQQFEEYAQNQRNSLLQNKKQAEKLKKFMKNRYPQFDQMKNHEKVMKQLKKSQQQVKNKIPIYSYRSDIGSIKYINKKRLIKVTKRNKHYRQSSPSKPHKNQRMSNYSERIIKIQQQSDKKNKEPKAQKLDTNIQPNFEYQQIIYKKNEEIQKLRKQLDLANCNIKMIEGQKKEIEEQLSEISHQMLRLTHQKTEQNSKNKHLEETDASETSQVKYKQQLQKMQEMNRQLLIKMQQLSNMLMDKQEEQVNYSEKSLAELTKIYDQKVGQQNQQCIIF